MPFVPGICAYICAAHLLLPSGYPPPGRQGCDVWCGVQSSFRVGYQTCSEGLKGASTLPIELAAWNDWFVAQRQPDAVEASGTNKLMWLGCWATVIKMAGQMAQHGWY